VMVSSGRSGLDKELRPGGEILALHDAYRAAAVSADPSTEEETPSGGKLDGTDRGHRVVRTKGKQPVIWKVPCFTRQARFACTRSPRFTSGNRTAAQSPAPRAFGRVSSGDQVSAPARAASCRRP
jgi:hypothetical protein